MKYANYPLQRLIKHTTGNVHAAIVDLVSIGLSMFRCANPPFTAKHLVAGEHNKAIHWVTGIPQL